MSQAQEETPKVPDASRQKEIHLLLDETLGISIAKTKEEKSKAVSRLLDLAEKSKGSPDEFYVILREAFPLIYEVKGFETLQQAHELLTSVFPEFKGKGAQFAAFYLDKTPSPSDAAKAVAYLIPRLREQVLLNHFDQSRKQLSLIIRNLRRLDEDKLAAQMVQNRSLLNDRKQALVAWKKAEGVLAVNAKDPSANQSAGIWLAVFESDWDRALPLLSLGPKSSLSEAAKSELNSKTLSVSVARGWVKAAGDETGVVAKALRKHAQTVYGQIDDESLSPLAQISLAKQIEDLGKLVATDGDSWKLVARKYRFQHHSPQGTLANRGRGRRKVRIDRANGRPIDLLAMVDPAQHAIVGKWERRGTDLVGLTHNHRRFMAPYAINGSYHLTMEFTRIDGSHDVGLILPVGNTRVDFLLAAYGNKLSGLGHVNGKWMAARRDPKSGFRRGPSIESGKRHSLEVRVLVENSSAAIEVILDKKPFLSWKGPISKLSGMNITELVLANTPGVLVLKNEVHIHKLELILLKSGRGQYLQGDWGTPFAKVASRPPAIITHRTRQWKSKRYFITEKPVSLPEAKLLASQLNGRLLTVSSPEEHDAIQELRGGKSLWMAGWRTEASNVWRDERNRPLHFLSGWIPGEPDNNGDYQRVMTYWALRGTHGWGDVRSTNSNTHACIEWGEEYSDD